LERPPAEVGRVKRGETSWKMIPEVPRGVLSDKKKFEKIDLFGWKIGRFRWDWQPWNGRRRR
jgi:hypothetical protein